MSTFDTHAVVWQMYFRADKNRPAILRACAACPSCPAPADVFLAGAR